MSASTPLPRPPRARRTGVGYLMACTAASLWGLNGTVAKVLLASGFSSTRLAELRSLGAFGGLLVVALLLGRARLQVRLRELGLLALFGIVGLAFIQWFYFLAIHRLAIGVALLIEYTAPLMLALWARLVLRERVRRRVWLALVLALAGLTLVLNVAHGVSLSGAGVGFSLLAALTYAFYLLLASHLLRRRDALSLLVWGFGFASLFWAAIAPWWSFPGRLIVRHVSLLGRVADHTLPIWVLVLWLILAGTILPFFLLVTALNHLPATRVGIVAMLEPVVATLVAWAWLGESLGLAQLLGGLVVLTGIALAQTAR